MSVAGEHLVKQSFQILAGQQVEFTDDQLLPLCHGGFYQADLTVPLRGIGIDMNRMGSACSSVFSLPERQNTLQNQILAPACRTFNDQSPPALQSILLLVQEQPVMTHQCHHGLAVQVDIGVFLTKSGQKGLKSQLHRGTDGAFPGRFRVEVSLVPVLKCCYIGPSGLGNGFRQAVCKSLPDQGTGLLFSDIGSVCMPERLFHTGQYILQVSGRQFVGEQPLVMAIEAEYGPVVCAFSAGDQPGARRAGQSVQPGFRGTVGGNKG